MTHRYDPKLKYPKRPPSQPTPYDSFQRTYGVLVPILANKLHPLLVAKRQACKDISYKSVEAMIRDMFIKLHYNDVVTLLNLLDEVNLETGAEREARDKLLMMRQSMELSFANRGPSTTSTPSRKDPLDGTSIRRR